MTGLRYNYQQNKFLKLILRTEGHLLPLVGGLPNKELLNYTLELSTL